MKLALAVIGIRLVFAVFLGSPIPGTHVLVTLPEVPLPDWAQGVRVGGRVTAEGLVFALYDGLKLAALLICVGAANALASPARLLKSLPGALYEVGVAVVVAMTFAPHLIADVRRLRSARRLRGRPDRGVRGLLQVGLPVLEGALERSVALAAAMDSRGYGRTAEVPAAVRRTTAVLTLGGLLGVCAGTYGLLTADGAGYGLAVLLAGVCAALGGLWLGGRRSVRTRYRPDLWGGRAWLVAASGAAVAALLIRAAWTTRARSAPAWCRWPRRRCRCGPRRPSCSDCCRPSSPRHPLPYAHPRPCAFPYRRRRRPPQPAVPTPATPMPTVPPPFVRRPHDPLRGRQRHL